MESRCGFCAPCACAKPDIGALNSADFPDALQAANHGRLELRMRDRP
jgi:hypothetical protein